MPRPLESALYALYLLRALPTILWCAGYIALCELAWSVRRR